jgi:CheY-like chemotaxis protein
MRILYTNYSSARTVLRAIFLKLGLKYEVAGNGAAVIEALQRHSGPRIAIVDSNLPGVNAFNICRRFKDTPPDQKPYIIVMTKESDRTQVLAALEAGADDFIQRPFDSTDVIARLKIAERTIAERENFQKQLAEARRRAAEQPPGPGPAPAVDEFLSDHDRRREPRQLFTDTFRQLNQLDAFSHFEDLIIKTLSGMGLNGAKPLGAGATSVTPDISVHCAAILPSQSVWLDIVLDLDRRSAEGLYAAITGSIAFSREDLLDKADEFMNAIQGAIKGSLTNAAIEVFTPLLPTRLSRDNREAIHLLSSECARVDFSIGDVTLCLSLIAHFAPIVSKSLEDACVRDVVADTVKLPGNPKLNLFEKGTLLTNHHLNQLQDIAGSDMRAITFETISPSELSVLAVSV